MKIHFSLCGKFKHIASIEGQVISSQITLQELWCSKNNANQELILSVFVYTHQLSTYKRARCPPRLIYKVKLNFGRITGLSLARLPVTFN
jgi:hypothetical protein